MFLENYKRHTRTREQSKIIQYRCKLGKKRYEQTRYKITVCSHIKLKNHINCNVHKLTDIIKWIINQLVHEI